MSLNIFYVNTSIAQSSSFLATRCAIYREIEIMFGGRETKRLLVHAYLSFFLFVALLGFYTVKPSKYFSRIHKYALRQKTFLFFCCMWRFCFLFFAPVFLCFFLLCHCVSVMCSDCGVLAPRQEGIIQRNKLKYYSWL